MENLFAERLKEARLRANMSMADLANITGLTASAISSYEATDETKSKAPTLPNAIKIAHALGVSLEWLSGEEKVKTIDDFSPEAVAHQVAFAFRIIEQHFAICPCSDLDEFINRKGFNTSSYLGNDDYLLCGIVDNHLCSLKTVNQAIEISHLNGEMAEHMRNKVREDFIKALIEEFQRREKIRLHENAPF